MSLIDTFCFFSFGLLGIQVLHTVQGDHGLLKLTKETREATVASFEQHLQAAVGQSPCHAPALLRAVARLAFPVALWSSVQLGSLAILPPSPCMGHCCAFCMCAFSRRSRLCLCAFSVFGFH